LDWTPHARRLRSFDGGIAIDSRYFATVLRATLMPWSARMSAIFLSDRGLFGFSAATSFLIRARIAVAEASPPVTVLTWLEKKYLNS
jgi:hypothetical protein